MTYVARDRDRKYGRLPLSSISPWPTLCCWAREVVGRGKWIPRLLREAERELASKFDDAFRQVWLGNVEELCNLTHAELDQHWWPVLRRRQAHGIATGETNVPH
jgi:hypothetical protein